MSSGGLSWSGTLAVADRVRLRWLRSLGPVGRTLVRRRELRVATIFSAVIVLSLLGTMAFPLWLLALGPMIWGVPHLVADFRYLVVRPGFGGRPVLCILGGIPLLIIALGGSLVWGFAGGVAVVVVARAPLRHRLPAAAVFVALGALALSAGSMADVIFGHAHNMLAVGLWWIWRRRTTKAHRIPLALLLAATVLLLSPYAVHSAGVLGSLGWHPATEGPEFQLWRLAPGLGPDIGMRLVLLFCFMQSVHYAIWMVLLPDEERPRATVMTFRASYEDLRRDMGTTALVVATLVSVFIATWALIDLADAGRGYFRMARFHGHLELMAVAVLLLERQPGKRTASALRG